MSDDRAREVADGLERVRTRVADAARGAGRDPDEVTLVVVTKFFPASDVRILTDLGVRHVGENRLQEAQAKREELADLDLTWHFLGQLQSNKAAAAGRWADVLHSLDRRKLLTPLGRGAHEQDRVLDVLLQVNLDTDEAVARDRGGVAPADATALAEQAAATAGLRLRGVMAVAPRGEDPRPAFERLAAVAAEVRTVVPDATWISAGMSGDLEPAVTCGATHVRVGGAILGSRPTNG